MSFLSNIFFWHLYSVFLLYRRCWWRLRWHRLTQFHLILVFQNIAAMLIALTAERCFTAAAQWTLHSSISTSNNRRPDERTYYLLDSIGRFKRVAETLQPKTKRDFRRLFAVMGYYLLHKSLSWATASDYCTGPQKSSAFGHCTQSATFITN